MRRIQIRLVLLVVMMLPLCGLADTHALPDWLGKHCVGCSDRGEGKTGVYIL